MKNQINFEGIKESLNTISTAADDIQSSLDAINTEITDSVGPEGRAWSGFSAQQFRTSWDRLAENIGDFKTTVNNQVNNIQLVLDKMSATDQNGSVEQ